MFAKCLTHVLDAKKCLEDNFLLSALLEIQFSLTVRKLFHKQYIIIY